MYALRSCGIGLISVSSASHYATLSTLHNFKFLIRQSAALTKLWYNCYSPFCTAYLLTLAWSTTIQKLCTSYAITAWVFPKLMHPSSPKFFLVLLAGVLFHILQQEFDINSIPCWASHLASLCDSIA